MAQQRLMKDGLDRDAIKRISHTLNIIIPNFDAASFERQALRNLPSLELKERVNHIIEVLAKHLPGDFVKTAKILQKLPKHWDWGDENDPLRGFAAWPLIDYVGQHGLDHPKEALATLKSLTHLFSAEFAIRPFITRHFDETYQQLQQWCTDENEHVRRLVSEGSRPRLPWGVRLPQFIKEPSPIFPLLELLKDDPSDYVRRSVANNLNDISKDHPERVIEQCQAWQRSTSKERQWIIRHATRTLIKAGHPEVFPLLGYHSNPKLEIKAFTLNKRKIKMGETLQLEITLQSTAKSTQKIVVDYAIHFVKANGKSSAKVFKLKNITLKPGETVHLHKSLAFKEITTRKYYPGEHSVELLINGNSKAQLSFQLRNL